MPAIWQVGVVHTVQMERTIEGKRQKASVSKRKKTIHGGSEQTDEAEGGETPATGETQARRKIRRTMKGGKTSRKNEPWPVGEPIIGRVGSY